MVFFLIAVEYVHWLHYLNSLRVYSVHCGWYTVYTYICAASGTRGSLSQYNENKIHSLMMSCHCMRSWELLSLLLNNHHDHENLANVIHSLVVSPSIYLEVVATDDRMKHTITFNKIMNFSGFEHRPIGIMKVHISTKYITKVEHVRYFII